MLVESQQLGCLRELTVLAAFLSIQDPRERPADAREAADLAHAAFGDARSDFMAILKLWDAYRVAHEDLTQSKLRDWCGARFLSFLRMREWRELHRQLLLVIAELGWKLEPERPPAPPPAPRPHAKAPREAEESAAERKRYESIHRALLSGLPGQVGRRDLKGGYQGARGRKFNIFPGSGLAKAPPPWAMSAMYLETARLYAHTNARVDPLWVEQQAAHLVKRRVFDPHWDRKTGSVKAFEEVSLFGLVLAEKRRIEFGRIDPVAARQVFLREAVLGGEMDFRGDLVRLLQQALAQAREEEAKRRRQGLVREEEELLAWLDARMPADVHTQAGLEAWWKPLPPEVRRTKIWTLDDLLVADAASREAFPPTLHVLGRRLKLHYRFEPGTPEDGVTLDVPLGLLNAMPAARLTWLVPGLLVDKVAELIRALPKSLRRNFVPAPDFARAFVADLDATDARLEARRDRVEETQSLHDALSAFLERRTGVPVPRAEWHDAELPLHLVMNVRLLDEHGRPLASSRDLESLRTEYGARARSAFAQATASEYAREDVTRWDFGELPAVVKTDAGLAAYPAVVDRGAAAAIARVRARGRGACRARAGRAAPAAPRARGSVEAAAQAVAAVAARRDRVHGARVARRIARRHRRGGVRGRRVRARGRRAHARLRSNRSRPRSGARSGRRRSRGSATSSRRCRTTPRCCRSSRRRCSASRRRTSTTCASSSRRSCTRDSRASSPSRGSPRCRATSRAWRCAPIGCRPTRGATRRA